MAARFRLVKYYHLPRSMEEMEVAVKMNYEGDRENLVTIMVFYMI